jgi:hypothetical protein
MIEISFGFDTVKFKEGAALAQAAARALRASLDECATAALPPWRDAREIAEKVFIKVIRPFTGPGPSGMVAISDAIRHEAGDISAIPTAVAAWHVASGRAIYCDRDGSPSDAPIEAPIA